jgi:hypothetical protein
MSFLLFLVSNKDGWAGPYAARHLRYHDARYVEVATGIDWGEVILMMWDTFKRGRRPVGSRPVGSRPVGSRPVGRRNEKAQS